MFVLLSIIIKFGDKKQSYQNQDMSLFPDPRWGFQEY